MQCMHLVCFVNWSGVRLAVPCLLVPSTREGLIRTVSVLEIYYHSVQHLCARSHIIRNWKCGYFINKWCTVVQYSTNEPVIYGHGILYITAVPSFFTTHLGHTHIWYYCHRYPSTEVTPKFTFPWSVLGQAAIFEKLLVALSLVTPNIIELGRELRVIVAVILTFSSHRNKPHQRLRRCHWPPPALPRQG